MTPSAGTRGKGEGRSPRRAAPSAGPPPRGRGGKGQAVPPRPEVDREPQTARPLQAQELLALYRPDLVRALLAAEAPSYRYEQVFEHLLRRPSQPLSQATVVPGSLRNALDALGPSTLALAGSRTAADGTTKLLLAGRDGSCVETVLMRYRDRVTVCISSQVGCPVGCGFCATGAMGFHRNLTTAEIVDQVRAASASVLDEGRRISNLVYMGMGEPLLNLQAVLESIRIVTDPRGMGLAHRAISVSTVGIPSGMLRLARAEPQVNLALSLHATDDRTRAHLIPEKFRHPLPEILDAAWEHFALTRRKLLVEYVLLRGVNDSVDDARRLASLLRGHVVTVNLLSLNSTRQVARTLPRQSGRPRPAAAQASPFAASPAPVVSAFRDALLGVHVETVVRRSKGSGIEAACGQLAARRRTYDEAEPG